VNVQIRLKHKIDLFEKLAKGQAVSVRRGHDDRLVKAIQNAIEPEKKLMKVLRFKKSL